MLRWLAIPLTAAAFCTVCRTQTQNIVPARPASTPNKPADVAGIPVNYDENKAGTYTLPDALIMAGGRPVRDAKTWVTKRRPEIVRLFETQQYGIAPGRPAGESFDIIENATPALDGKALRKQVTIYLNAEKSGPHINLLVYLPAGVKRPVPLLLSINFGAVQNAVDDAGIRPGQVWDAKTNTKVDPPKPGAPIGRIDARALLDAGIGVATFYYGDVEPDYKDGFSNGVRAAYLQSADTRPRMRGDRWRHGPGA